MLQGGGTWNSTTPLADTMRIVVIMKAEDYRMLQGSIGSGRVFSKKRTHALCESPFEWARDVGAAMKGG